MLAVKTLVSSREVIDLAFASSPGISTDQITEPVILSAQQKFIRPVVGALYERLENGELPELLDKYLKPALAFYVKLLALPIIAASVGQLGILQHKSGAFAPATDKTISALKKRARGDANTLMRRAVEHIEENRDLYPEYEPKENVLNRLSVSSEIVI